MSAVLITGSNRGIGLELVKVYLAQSRPVIACARDPERADALQDLKSDHADLTLEALNVADPGSVRALKSRLGRRPLDIVINNAGIGGPFLDQEPEDDLDIDAWLKTLHVNTVAPLQVLRQLRSNLAAGTSPKAVTISSQMGAISFQMPRACS